MVCRVQDLVILELFFVATGHISIKEMQLDLFCTNTINIFINIKKNKNDEDIFILISHTNNEFIFINFILEIFSYINVIYVQI